MSHRLHIIGLPHTATTLEYSSCAYTEKVRKFCNEMSRRGHHVTLYGGWGNDATVNEFVSCATQDEASAMAGNEHFTSVKSDHPMWSKFNKRVIAAMCERIRDRDFICNSFGWPQREVSEAFPGNMVVEYGIGYSGTFSNYQIFESYAWMHMHYAKGQREIFDVDGKWFHDVIPGFFDPDLFPKLDVKREDYVMFCGRILNRKGIDVAVQATQRAGVKLIVAGSGTPPIASHVEYVGELNPKQRNEYLSRARALIAPSYYIEPFGNVVTEALACGTPAITTDWGAFTETVQQGVDGFRCRTLNQFNNAIHMTALMKHDVIRERAFSRFSAPVVGQYFDLYFDRLNTLWENGWNQ